MIILMPLGMAAGAVNLRQLRLYYMDKKLELIYALPLVSCLREYPAQAFRVIRNIKLHFVLLKFSIMKTKCRVKHMCYFRTH